MNDLMGMLGFSTSKNVNSDKVLVDVSYFAQRTFHGKFRSGERVCLTSMRYTLLTTLLYRFKKLGVSPSTHEIILCYDGSNYWQKEIAPYYKCTRKNRKPDGKDWDGFRHFMNELQEEIVKYFPFTVLRFVNVKWTRKYIVQDNLGNDVELESTCMNGVEADDVIGILAERFSNEGRNVIVMTGDGDFTQLDYLQRVKIMDYDCKQIIPKYGCGAYDLMYKIVNGDTKDSVANILSRSNYWENKLEGEKQKSASKLAKECFTVDDPLTLLDEEQKERFLENQILKDFKYIPKDIAKHVNDVYDDYQRNEKNEIYNLFYEIEVNEEVIQEDLKKLIMKM